MAENLDNVSAYEHDHNPSTSFAIAASLNNDVSLTYADKDITFTGDLQNYDYSKILKQKQFSIYEIFQLSDYFLDAEELYGSALKCVYVPFSLTDGWFLTGGSSKVRDKYYEWLDRIHFQEKLESWFLQYYMFANVYMSIQEDGDIVSLPPNLVRISNVMLNGNPLIEFNARSVKQDLKKNGQKAWKKFIDDEQLDVRLQGYPIEVSEALKGNKEWVQLDARRTLVWHGVKPEWQRYAIPMVVMCLKPFAKKALISAWEDAQLQLGIAGFVHAAVGAPKDSQVVVDRPILEAVQGITKQAMRATGGLATTQDTVKYDVITPKLDYLFEDDKYKGPNTEILGALGINDTVSSGSDTSVSFGSSQISTKMVSLRITQARRGFCELMNRILRVVNGADFGLPRSNESKMPHFEMPVADLTQVAAFQSACKQLWDAGALSTKTYLRTYGIDADAEFEQKKSEKEAGYDDVFTKPGTTTTKETGSNTDSDGDNPVGRPTMDDSERNSDPGNSETGRQPKPSSESGSEKQEQ